MTTLFDTVTIGTLELSNRLVMAPMTRSRADTSGVVGPLVAEYYAQRASAGLIITEGTQISTVSQGYTQTPGLHTAEQIAGWRTVTDAVHAGGGHIFAQLMHVGRIGHVAITGVRPVGASPIAAPGQSYTYDGLKDYEDPRELATGEIAETIADYVTSARNAIEAGFDGVELHGANGYLIQQFLSTNTNQRTDEYGGDVAGRIRFAVEVTTAVAEAIGPQHVGLRISPANTFNGIAETDTAELYPALVSALNPLGLAYLHVLAGATTPELVAELRGLWTQPILLNATPTDKLVDVDVAQTWLDSGADAIVFGRAFIANPDLVERLRSGAELNEPDYDAFYGGDHTGYTDYPVLASA